MLNPMLRKKFDTSSYPYKNNKLNKLLTIFEGSLFLIFFKEIIYV